MNNLLKHVIYLVNGSSQMQILTFNVLKFWLNLQGLCAEYWPHSEFEEKKHPEEKHPQFQKKNHFFALLIILESSLITFIR